MKTLDELNEVVRDLNDQKRHLEHARKIAQRANLTIGSYCLYRGQYVTLVDAQNPDSHWPSQDTGTVMLGIEEYGPVL